VAVVPEPTCVVVAAEVLPEVGSNGEVDGVDDDPVNESGAPETIDALAKPPTATTTAAIASLSIL
jgi:hypothetical protein